jgi:hypothetical protein
MNVTIKLTKHEAYHLKSPHTFYDECESACSVLRKIQKQIDKRRK